MKTKEETETEQIIRMAEKIEKLTNLLEEAILYNILGTDFERRFNLILKTDKPT